MARPGSRAGKAYTEARSQTRLNPPALEVDSLLTLRLTSRTNNRNAGVDVQVAAQKKKVFGKARGLIAADIACQPDIPKSGVYIDIDGKVIFLQAKSGTKYEVDFSNMELEKEEDLERARTSSSERYVARIGKSERKDTKLYKGDFDIYYDSLKDARERYALWGLPVKTQGSRTDYDAVWMDDPDLEA